MEGEVRARVAAIVTGPFELARHDTRWLALGAEVVAFAAENETEWRRLEAERWLNWHGPGTERHPQIVEWVTAVLERLV